MDVLFMFSLLDLSKTIVEQTELHGKKKADILGYPLLLSITYC